MRGQVDFKLAIWHAEHILEMLTNGELGLPDFQRRFEWSTVDVRAFLSTVLGGLPSGNIMVAPNDLIHLALRELEGAPTLHMKRDALVLLDGQQRITALLQAALDVGPYEYFVDFRALEGGADVVQDDVVVSIRRGHSSREGVVPFSALRNASTFYSWLSANSEVSDRTVRIWGEIFSSKVRAFGDYQFPVTLLGGELGMATVAQIFERTNKWGQRLDAFDLLVARLQSSGWALREAWREATSSSPEIGRVFGENGLAAIGAISLRKVQDVRRNAVLSLPPSAIEAEWARAIGATASVARLLLGEGVRKPELVTYDSLVTTMIAARMEDADERLLRHYYWLGSVNRWHEVASNSRVVSDYRFLRQGRIDPSRPASVPPLEEFELNTRRSSRALWAAIISVLLTAEPRDLVTGEPVTSVMAEADDVWSLVPFATGGSLHETSRDVPVRLRTAAQVFVLPGMGGRLRRRGLMSVLHEREQQPALFGSKVEDDLRSQLLPPSSRLIAGESPRSLVRRRAFQIQERLVERLN